MVRQKDRFWDYATKSDTKTRFVCKFCSKDFAGGVSRVKSHLSGLPGRDVMGCVSVPEDVQAEAILAIKANETSNKKARSTSSSQIEEAGSSSSLNTISCSDSNQHQTTVPTMYSKKDKEGVDRALANFFFIQEQAFLEIVKVVSNYGVGYSVPSYSTLRTKLVKNAKMEVDDYVAKVKDSWAKLGTGCTLMSDGWTYLKGRSFINVIAYCPKGVVFIKSVEDSSKRKTGDYLNDLICSVINEIGAANVTQVVTDNAANYESAGNMIMGQYPHIYKLRCAAHGVNLLLKDIYRDVEWVRRIFDQAKEVVDFMYKYTIVLKLMRQHTSDKELKKPCKTRFATNFLMLQSVIEVEEPLRLMVASLEFRNMNYSTSEMGKKITETIQSTPFWVVAKDVIGVLEPLVRILRLVDGEGSTVGYLFEAMERAREALRKLCARDRMKYDKIFELFETRRETNILHSMHVVAAFFNPLLLCNGKIRYDHPEVKKGLLFVAQKMITTESERMTFGTQVTEYNIQSSEIFTSLALHQMETIHPRVWWS